MTQHVAIIGAGIVGVSTAIWLQRAGYDVTIVDPKGPAGGASFGNAGVLASASIVPVPVPGLLKKVPGMLLDRNQPLFLRWSYLPRLVPFLLPFLRNGTMSKVEDIADALSLLLGDSVEQHKALSQGTGAERFVHDDDYVYGYRDKAAFEADAFAWAMRRAGGHRFEELSPDAFAEYDPALKGCFGYGVRCLDHGRISDPPAYVKALAEHVTANGGTLIKAEVLSLLEKGTAVRGVVTSQGPVEAEQVVLAAGMWSRDLARSFGVKVPMEAERGYHIEFIKPSIMPKSPTMVASGKFVLTPMEGRLRAAGIVEFGGMSEIRSRAPFDLLRRQALETLPDLTFDRVDEWMGFRPSTTDSLPLIGAIDSAPNLWFGFGHQHVGLTGGPKTGRWLAQLIAGERINTDLTPFQPGRFG